MKGGRLESAFTQYVNEQKQLAQGGATQAFERVKQETQGAIERMIGLAKNPENGPVCFKANEYLLDIAGLSHEATLESFFEKLTYQEAKKRVDQLFVKLYNKGVSEEMNISIVTRCEQCGKTNKGMGFGDYGKTEPEEIAKDVSQPESGQRASQSEQIEPYELQ